MMKFSVLIATLFCAFVIVPGQVVFAGEATSEKTFVVKTDYEKEFNVWWKKHRTGILKASNCEITRSLEKDKLQVKTKTPIGTWHYVLRESVDVKEASSLVTLKLVDGLKTKITQQQVTIAVKPVKSGTQITLRIHMKVNSRVAPSTIIRWLQKSSISDVQKYLAAKFE